MNSNHQDTTKSTKELKQQVLKDIKKVKEDFQVIKTRMTPGQIIDDALFYRGTRDPREIFDHLKSNPMGTTFLTFGTFLLMEDENHRSFETLTKEKFSEVKGKVSTAGHHLSENISERIDQTKSELSSTRNKVLDKTSEYTQNVNPMIYMALGMGLGTVTGAALPVMDSEEKVVDSVLSNKMERFSQELQNALNESMNIFKNEVMGDLTDYKFDLFGKE